MQKPSVRHANDHFVPSQTTPSTAAAASPSLSSTRKRHATSLVSSLQLLWSRRRQNELRVLRSY